MCGSQVVLATVTPVLSEHGPELLSKLPRPLRRTMGLLNKENNIGTPLGNGNNIACVPPFDAPMPQQQCHQQQSQSQPQQTPQPSSPRRPIAISRSLSFSQSSVNPYNEFLLMTKQGNGASHISFEEKRNDIGNVILEWGCRVTFQMTKSSAWRTHHRFGQTKKKAKFLVLHDINNYYKKYPEQALQDKLIVPDVGQPENALDLPIDPSDYCHDTVQQKQQESSPATPELPTYWYSPFPGLSDTQAIHIPDKRNRTMEEEDEYAQHMMNVLLGDFPKISLEHDGLSKRHKKMTVSTMETTTEYTTTTTMMDSDDIMTPPSSAASLLPDTIHPPNNSAESVTDLGAIRKMVDVSRLDKMINDPVQAANPKSSLFSYIHNIKGLEVKSEFEENGPAHQKIFETTTSVFGGGYTVSGRGMGLKKSDSEQMAILNLMKKIVGVA
ncbi:hypothetical protein BDA99DRAFT_189383 [Phascolomyces articulosus]|uniref:DRBM domain-containing protein n=1 Tax=Phascolomyces articulosus TaxID=60185 RepID=A0AAD5KME7_9FUNG|nr:hypothetical protein BDA99DRAFT_189383 [Phascolomyces articulosus]